MDKKMLTGYCGRADCTGYCPDCYDEEGYEMDESDVVENIQKLLDTMLDLLKIVADLRQRVLRLELELKIREQ